MPALNVAAHPLKNGFGRLAKYKFTVGNPVYYGDQSGQKIKIVGIVTQTMRISSGNPMRQ